MNEKTLNRRDFLRLAAMAAAGTAVAACAPKAAETATSAPAATATAKPAATPTPAVVAKKGGEMTFGYGQKTSYSHFMHLREYAGGEWIYSKNWACSRLVGYRRGEGYIPDLADAWELSNEDKTLTFSLNKSVEWHDGTPFTAGIV